MAGEKALKPLINMERETDVDEFTYRLNEGNCKVHTLDRIDALIRKTSGVRLTYAILTETFA